MASTQTMVEPMSEAERRDLLRVIEQRKLDLIEKRKLLEKLGVSVPKRPETTQAAGNESSSMVKDVMSAIQQAQAAAVVAPAPTDTEAAKTGKKEGFATIDPNAKYSHTLKKLIGPLATRSGVVDVIITPHVMDRFDKSCQCDSAPLGEAPVPATPPPTTSTTQGGAKVSADDVKKTKPVSVSAGVSVPKSPMPELLSKSEEPLSEEERKKLLYNSEFTSFFNKASRLVEKALGESEMFDVFADYTQLKTSADEGTSVGERLRKLETYVDDRWSANRPVMNVRTHPKFRELFLVSYGQKENGSLQDPDGCALVWNLAMPQRAEYVFTCQSQVCTAMFDPYNPNIIVGGTFTGSVVVWDTRERARPVQRTPLSTKCHHHPVYSMEIVGTEHAHNLVTVDLDGRLCLWSLSMLVQPTETIDLKRNGKELTCHCISFADGENNSFLGGAEDGSLFQVQIHGNKGGVTESYPGHLAPVTGVHWHPSSEGRGLGDSAVDCSDLVLSSSCDWSVKLWSPRSRASPLHSFEAVDDYCTAVEWHPYNPSIFASSQADGTLNIWDISKDIEVPYATQAVGSDALTRIKWSNDGCRLMTGDVAGNVSMWGVSNEICQPRQDDLTRLSSTIEELKAAERGPRDP